MHFFAWKTMNYSLLISLAASVFAANSVAQERIYRCGNEYTNTVPSAQTHGCKLVSGGNVTVVQGTRPAASSPAARPASAAALSGGPRIDASAQKSRDSDARQILESELKKAEARQAELLKEYNNGEPEKQGSEGRNNQKYLDRVAELKASLARNESDIAGIRRELGRVPAAAAAK
jgi:hypothetical protein